MGERPAPVEGMETIEQLRGIIQNALLSARKAVVDLGSGAIELVPSPLSYDNDVMKGDLEAERAVINYLENSGLSVAIHSEEHSWQNIGAQHAEYLSVLDGIDGSNEFRKQDPSCRSGTMLGLFRGADPTYDDYLIGGIIEYPSGKFYTASRGEGAFAQAPNAEPVPIHANGQKILRPGFFYVDNNPSKEYKMMQETAAMLTRSGFKPKPRLGSSAMHYAEVADGRIDAVIECTRKGNLEIATAYGIIKEAGGVMLDIEGNPLGTKKYREFGQNEKLLVITAATQELANEIINNIK